MIAKMLLSLGNWDNEFNDDVRILIEGCEIELRTHAEYKMLK